MGASFGLPLVLESATSLDGSDAEALVAFGAGVGLADAEFATKAFAGAGGIGLAVESDGTAAGATVAGTTAADGAGGVTTAAV